MTITIDLRALYGDTAKLAELDAYVSKALALAGDGNEVVITGPAPKESPVEKSFRVSADPDPLIRWLRLAAPAAHSH